MGERDPLFPVSWRLLDTPPASGAWNMALDEALMEAVRQGGPPVLRFYRWSPGCLSLGRNQPAAGRYDSDALRVREVEVVRRLTGGRAVLHDRELTYSVVMPEGVLGSPRESYTAINRALVAGLRRLGVPAVLQPRTRRRAPVPSLAPCFREPAEGEVVVGGRKLVGSAQYRERGVVLQHGSLLLEDDQGTVRELLRESDRREDPPPAVLSEFCRPLPCWEALTEALVQGWAEALGARAEPEPLTPAEKARVEAISMRYADPAWTWRR